MCIFLPPIKTILPKYRVSESLELADRFINTNSRFKTKLRNVKLRTTGKEQLLKQIRESQSHNQGNLPLFPRWIFICKNLEMVNTPSIDFSSVKMSFGDIEQKVGDLQKKLGTKMFSDNEGLRKMIDA